MKVVRRRVPLGDLFAIFPDLPWARRRPLGAQRERMQRIVAAAKQRARENQQRQREASRRFQATVAARRRLL